MNDMHPYLLSVRLMTFNHSEFIIEAMESIDAQQTNFDYEVWVGDDFSTDGTWELVNNFRSKNPKAHWHIIPREKGGDYHQARLKNGRVENFYDILTKCKGKYIALLDGDDYWTDTNKLQKQVDFLESHEKAVGCFHNSKVVDAQGNTTWPQYYEGKDGTWFDQYDSLSVLRSAYSTGSLVFRNEAIQKELSTFHKIGTDFILEALITNHGKLYFMDKNMSAYRFHEGGVWQGNTEEKNNLEIVRRYRFLFETPIFRKRYNSFLWKTVMQRYDEMLRRSKDPQFSKMLNSELIDFLNFREFRTYTYLSKRGFTSLRYRWKILKKKFKS